MGGHLSQREKWRSSYRSSIRSAYYNQRRHRTNLCRLEDWNLRIAQGSALHAAEAKRRPRRLVCLDGGRWPACSNLSIHLGEAWSGCAIEIATLHLRRWRGCVVCTCGLALQIGMALATHVSKTSRSRHACISLEGWRLTSRKVRPTRVGEVRTSQQRCALKYASWCRWRGGVRATDDFANQVSKTRRALRDIPCACGLRAETGATLTTASCRLRLRLQHRCDLCLQLENLLVLLENLLVLLVY